VSDDFRQRLNRVEALVGVLERCTHPATLEAARELLRTLLDLHAAGLSRILDTAGRESALVGRLADDDLVSSLFLLHGLHPYPAAQRVSKALERDQPRFRSLGGAVELIAANDQAVHVRVRGNASPALRVALEELVTRAVPDAALDVEEVADAGADGRVPLPLVATAGAQT
jgi:hypothetical protein